MQSLRAYISSFALTLQRQKKAYIRINVIRLSTGRLSGIAKNLLEDGLSCTEKIAVLVVTQHF